MKKGPAAGPDWQVSPGGRYSGNPEASPEGSRFQFHRLPAEVVGTPLRQTYKLTCPHQDSPGGSQ
jgi:hypothetical protein